MNQSVCVPARKSTFFRSVAQNVKFSAEEITSYFFGSLSPGGAEPLKDHQLVRQHRNHRHFTRGDSPASEGWLFLKKQNKQKQPWLRQSLDFRMTTTWPHRFQSCQWLLNKLPFAFCDRRGSLNNRKREELKEKTSGAKDAVVSKSCLKVLLLWLLEAHPPPSGLVLCDGGDAANVSGLQTNVCFLLTSRRV